MMIFTICRPCLNQIYPGQTKISHVKTFSFHMQSFCCKVNANTEILVILKIFTKSLREIAYFNGLKSCPTFLVQSVEGTFGGKNKFKWFRLVTVCAGLHPFSPRWMRGPSANAHR